MIKLSVTITYGQAEMISEYIRLNHGVGDYSKVIRACLDDSLPGLVKAAERMNIAIEKGGNKE